MIPSERISRIKEFFTPSKPEKEPFGASVSDLDRCIKEVSKTLKQVKTANKEFERASKPLSKIKEERKIFGALAQDTQDHTHRRVFDRELGVLDEQKLKISNAVEKSSKALKSASILHRDLETRLRRETPNDPKVKKVKALLNQLSVELHKQEELALKKIENNISKSTGNSIFKSIFKIKTVDKKNIPLLRESARKLRIFESRVGTEGIRIFGTQIDKLNDQIGRGLLIGYGIKTDKDISEFLKLSLKELKNKKIHLDDAAEMARYIGRNQKGSNIRHIQGEIQRGAIEATIDKLETTSLLSKEELSGAEELFTYLGNTKRDDPNYEEFQKLRIKIHSRLHPEYFKELRGFIEDFKASPRDPQNFARYSKEYVLLQAYQKNPTYKKEATQALASLLLAKDPKFLGTAQSKLNAFSKMDPLTFQDQSSDVEYYLKQLDVLREGAPTKEMANEAYKLKLGFNKLVDNK